MPEIDRTHQNCLTYQIWEQNHLTLSPKYLAWFLDGPRSLAHTPSSPDLIYFVGSLVPDVIVCLNSWRTTRSQLYYLLEFELLKCKQLRRRQMFLCRLLWTDFSLFQAFCGSPGQISKDNMPSESYKNVLIDQGNDFTIKTRKIW